MEGLHAVTGLSSFKKDTFNVSFMFDLQKLRKASLEYQVNLAAVFLTGPLP